MYYYCGKAVLLCDVLWQDWLKVAKNRHKWGGGEGMRGLSYRNHEKFNSQKVISACSTMEQ